MAANRPSKLKIRTGDQVVVISGKDRGKTGQVQSVDPKRQRVVVEGLNIRTRHTRPRPGSSEPGGIVQDAAPIHVSNVMLLDPSDNKPTRVGVVRENGARHRTARRTGNRID